MNQNQIDNLKSLRDAIKELEPVMQTDKVALDEWLHQLRKDIRELEKIANPYKQNVL